MEHAIGMIETKGLTGAIEAAVDDAIAAGALAYYVAIDSNSNWHPDWIKGVKNHVRAALAELKVGRMVSVAKTRTYGCSVKYVN